MDFIFKPWPWYVIGPLIGLFVPVMAMLGKKLGISSNLKHVCAIVLPTSKTAYLQYSLKEFHWSLWFFAGLFAGGAIGQFLLSDVPIVMLPPNYFSVSGAALLFVGGLAIGFGTRYAEGCTSGHAISGLSNLQKASLVASVSFFAGGLSMRAVNALFGGVI
ncbi:MAG: YeeE/YedE family protein [Deltaproteobacteria bacterium]|nr:YeeE/YedE family protein [Deltaproteobacteria bacterium]MBN2671332.1 YeeE/YedE family protein [Deltaproteobacteria bacterium]